MGVYTIGVDFGTLSGRGVLMDARTGAVLASASESYPHSVMTEELPDGTPLAPHSALQVPGDYTEVLHKVVTRIMGDSLIDPGEVVGIGIDFTTCTMLPVDDGFVPLCEDSAFSSDPHAYVKLWKHHGASAEADRITELARERGEAFLGRLGGRISPEWMLPKIMETLHRSPAVYEHTFRFIEAADWLFYKLTANEVHSQPFAGFKALWHRDGGYPSSEFFGALDPRLADLVGGKLSETVTPIDERGHTLTPEAAAWLGLSEKTAVAIPMMDAHASMSALGIVDEGTLMMILGTSTCLILHGREERDIPGICGQVKDGIMPGLVTYEAGQACCGDHFGWFVQNGVPEAYEREARAEGMGIHAYLRKKAEKLSPGESGLLALDWWGGNRSVLEDSSLRGMILGLTLQTKPEEIYRALIEATAYGARMVLENYESAGISARRIVASGGIAQKDAMLMQIYADVLNCPIVVSSAPDSAALGSAIYASVAAGLYEEIRGASRALSAKEGKIYRPIAEHTAVYQTLFEEYQRLHDYFGRGENPVMKRLDAESRAIKERKHS